MLNQKTAVILIGFQNDYFSPDGVLLSFLEQSEQRKQLLSRTQALVDRALEMGILVISTPICFTPDYSELAAPTGILAAIKEVGAFRDGTKGAETVPELLAYGDQIQHLPGKRGLNAFSNTQVEQALRDRGIDRVVLAGVVTSICIDSTGRSAFELGFDVTILSDCTAGRTQFEQDYYCDNIFTLYASVCTRDELFDSLAAKV